MLKALRSVNDHRMAQKLVRLIALSPKIDCKNPALAASGNWSALRETNERILSGKIARITNAFILPGILPLDRQADELVKNLVPIYEAGGVKRLTRNLSSLRLRLDPALAIAAGNVKGNPVTLQDMRLVKRLAAHAGISGSLELASLREAAIQACASMQKIYALNLVQNLAKFGLLLYCRICVLCVYHP